MKLRLHPFLAVFSVLLGSLATAAPEHPRLLFPAEMEATVQERIAKDPLAAKIHAAALKTAESQLDQRVCEYRIPDGKRLLAESRRSLSIIVHNAWAWRMTGDVRFRDRAIREMDGACALPDWNPKHFLDVAEMSTAMALGYDWLYGELSPEQRIRYEDNLWTKALLPIEKSGPKATWWRGAKNNWTQVCATGMFFSAEMLRNREPESCEKIIQKANALILESEVFYEPDGVYPEGPGYWSYGTSYHVLSLAAQDALGQKSHVTPALLRSGLFIAQMVGPSDYVFNYADSGSGVWSLSPDQCWLATRGGDVQQITHLRTYAEERFDAMENSKGSAETSRLWPLSVLWLPDAVGEKVETPLATVFQGKQAIASLRTGLERNAAWIAIKGGTGAVSHGHMDVGSFVFEAGGIRWFEDLGADNYNMPGYFGKQRWDYLRMTNLAHNTLVIDGQLQKLPQEDCPIISHDWSEGAFTLTLDLSLAYEGQAEKVLREVKLVRSTGEIQMRDTIEKPVGDVRWAAITSAKPRLSQRKLTLSRGKAGHKLAVERSDEGVGDWEIYSLKPNTEQENQNKGKTQVGFPAPKADTVVMEVRWRLAK